MQAAFLSVLTRRPTRNAPVPRNRAGQILLAGNEGVGGSLGRFTLGIDRVRRIAHSPIKSDKWQRQLINLSLSCRCLAAGITGSQVEEEAAAHRRPGWPGCGDQREICIQIKARDPE